MQDQDEQQRIRAAYEAEPGKGHLVEQLMGERENALATGDDASVIRVEDQMAVLGYQTPQQREDAASARKADAERRQREGERVKANRGEAAARDDGAGGEDEQKSGAAGDVPSREELARRQPPAERHAPAEQQSKTVQSGKATAAGSGTVT